MRRRDDKHIRCPRHRVVITFLLIEEPRSSLSQMFVQPFIAYTTKTHTTFTIDTESMAEWNASSSDGKWPVPAIFQISQILKIGKQPISIVQGFVQE